MVSNHHEPLSALSPVEWEHVPQDDGLGPFLQGIFSQSQTVIESIPSPLSAADPHGDRARAKTDRTDADADTQPDAADLARRLRGEWKDVKVNARDNPLGISVFKLAAKDGKGAWFARRSLHGGVSFDKCRLALGREFRESIKVQGAPGSGNIRGIGADKVVEHHVVPGVGQAEVYQLSAQFPGPTTPRDFITLLLTSESSFKLAGESRPLRQYVIVSKPCQHPECPPRDGIIRGRYESVEIIREVPHEDPAAKKSWSSADLAADETKGKGSSNASDTEIQKPGKASGPNDESRPLPIEWLMVTRSDPGGSVPRFMIEKGTPPGIVGDADKFLKWAKSTSAEELASTLDDGDPLKKNAIEAERANSSIDGPLEDTKETSLGQDMREGEQEEESGGTINSNGLFGMITGAFGAASSMVTSGWRRQLDSAASSHSSLSETAHAAEHAKGEDSSDSSSVHSFASAVEKSASEEKGRESLNGNRSDESKPRPGEKELRKLEERRRKLNEKLVKAQERAQSKKQGDSDKDAAAAAKLREKHEREMAKQEDKYRRELQKLEDKRQQEERKAADRRRKAAEREEKARLSLELERTRAERDVALKKVDLLERHVADLQAENTRLAAAGSGEGVGGFDGKDSSISEKSLKAGSGRASPAAS